MALTDKKIQAAKPKAKSYKIYDERGLFLYISTTGSKSWRVKYMDNGKNKEITLGQYPILSLADARQMRNDAIKQRIEGIDPAEHKQQEKKKAKQNINEKEKTFEVVANEWIKKVETKLTKKTLQAYIGRLNNHVLPKIGTKPIKEITIQDYLNIIRLIESRQEWELAKRVAHVIRYVSGYAELLEYIENDVSTKLPRLMQARPANSKKNLPAITSRQGVADMLKKIKVYTNKERSSPFMNAALQLFPLMALRSQEILKAEWSHIDFEKAIWRIPSENVKTRKEHTVFLSRQALEILKELYQYRTTKYIFPSGSKYGHISDNGFRLVMQKAGIPKGQMCPHGWRSVFSTLANEVGVPTKIIERQLSHVAGDRVELAYNRAKYDEVRRYFSQWWADFLDSLRDDTELPKIDINLVDLFN